MRTQADSRSRASVLGEDPDEVGSALEFLIVLAWLGAFVYLIARGKSMNDRQMAARADAKAQQDAYIQKVAAGSSDPTAQIASAKSLMDSGAISEAEYQALKAKALA